MTCEMTCNSMALKIRPIVRQRLLYSEATFQCATLERKVPSIKLDPAFLREEIDHTDDEQSDQMVVEDFKSLTNAKNRRHCKTKQLLDKVLYTPLHQNHSTFR